MTSTTRPDTADTRLRETGPYKEETAAAQLRQEGRPMPTVKALTGELTADPVLSHDGRQILKATITIRTATGALIDAEANPPLAEHVARSLHRADRIVAVCSFDDDSTQPVALVDVGPSLRHAIAHPDRSSAPRSTNMPATGATA